MAAKIKIAIISKVVVLGHVSGLYEIPYIRQIEDILYDTRVRLSAPGGVDDRIVIVAIDENSLQEHGHWPFSRERRSGFASWPRTCSRRERRSCS